MSENEVIKTEDIAVVTFAPEAKVAPYDDAAPAAPVVEEKIAAPAAPAAPVAEEKIAEVAAPVAEEKAEFTADPFAAVEGQEGDQGNVSATAPEDALSRHSKRTAS